MIRSDCIRVRQGKRVGLRRRGRDSNGVLSLMLVVAIALIVGGAFADDDSAGGAACIKCHDDIQANRVGSQHGQIDCEGCHGPLGAHARDPEANEPEAIGEDLCLMCHESGVGMPDSYSTVNPKDHHPGKACVSCHPAHHPEEGKH